MFFIKRLDVFKVRKRRVDGGDTGGVAGHAHLETAIKLLEAVVGHAGSPVVEADEHLCAAGSRMLQAGLAAAFFSVAGIASSRSNVIISAGYLGEFLYKIRAVGGDVKNRTHDCHGKKRLYAMRIFVILHQTLTDANALC